MNAARWTLNQRSFQNYSFVWNINNDALIKGPAIYNQTKSAFIGRKTAYFSTFNEKIYQNAHHHSGCDNGSWTIEMILYFHIVFGSETRGTRERKKGGINFFYSYAFITIHIFAYSCSINFVYLPLNLYSLGSHRFACETECTGKKVAQRSFYFSLSFSLLLICRMFYFHSIAYISFHL